MITESCFPMRPISNDQARFFFQKFIIRGCWRGFDLSLPSISDSFCLNFHPSPPPISRPWNPARRPGGARQVSSKFQWRSQEFDWGGVYVLTSHCNFITCVNVPHVNKTVTDLGEGIYIPIYPPSLRPWSGWSPADKSILVLSKNQRMWR